jgi:hypothetical protein
VFLLNLEHRWNLATSVDALNGALFLPSGNSSAKLTRARTPEFQRLLFDPQIYLSGLDCETCDLTCSRLATYPWFATDDVPEFDSGESTRSEWEKAVRSQIRQSWVGKPPVGQAIAGACHSALEFQLSLSCTHMILPSPLIEEREDEVQVQSEWLDQALAAAEELEIGQPLLATVAIAEAVLNDAAFDEGGFIEAILDQVTARTGIDGVYILIAQTHAQNPNSTDSRVLRAYLTLSHACAKAGYSTVLTNYAGVFGLACMGVGATGFACGASHKLRRLSLEGFQDSGGGLALPKFYSHRSVAEFLTETELDPIVERRLLRRIRDVTPHSQALMETLAADGTAAQLQAWAESQNNLTVSHMHFIHRLCTEANGLARLGPKQRRANVRDWLEDADANVTYMRSRFDQSGAELHGTIAPSGNWLHLLDILR